MTDDVPRKLPARQKHDEVSLEQGLVHDDDLHAWVTAERPRPDVEDELLLDEGEALLGRRTEVRDAHDRFADAEVSAPPDDEP